MWRVFKWFIRVVLYLLLVMAGVVTVICVFVYLNQDKVIFLAEKLPLDHKFKFAYDEERFYTPEHGARLNALLFKGKQQTARGLIYYLHGNTGSLRNWGRIARRFTQYGYDVLVFDYRIYGKSRGEVNEQTLLKDAEYVYQQLLKEYPENKVVIYGRSLGSGLAAFVAAHNMPKMLILETPYYSFIDLVQHLGKQYNIPWFPYTIVLKYHLRTDLYLPQVKSPVYLFHGQLDELIYYESSQKLARFFKKDDLLFSVPDGKHADLWRYDEFNQNLAKVLTKK
ncbi:alpha/beta hydrolase [Microscilla marina]|nr:alpha/beta fold hydrolase [Microscilla marina]